MLRRIAIEGYKSLGKVDVELAPLTVVFGANAAGKSNLLDALGLLARIVTSDNLDSAFVGHRGAPLEAFTIGPGGLEGLMSQGTARFTMTADVMLSDAVIEAVERDVRRAREGLPSAGTNKRSIIERRLRYTVSVEIRTASGHLRVVDEKLEALNADWTPRQSRKPFIERANDHPNRLHLRMEKQGHPSYEELGQDRALVSKPLYPPHYPHIAAFREELTRWRFYFLEPSAMREEVPLKEVETLASTGSDLAAFYNSLFASNSLQFQALSKAIRQVVPSINSLQVDRTKQGFVRLMVDENGTVLPSRLISEGTLRVLGLLAITNPLKALSMVGYEEPENGVHPSRLALVARLLISATQRGQTQFIINSHSPVLPEHFIGIPNATLVHCKRVNRMTTFETFDARPTLFNASEIEAALDEEATSSFRERIVRGDFNFDD